MVRLGKVRWGAKERKGGKMIKGFGSLKGQNNGEEGKERGCGVREIILTLSNYFVP